MRIVFRPVQTEAANPASTVNELVLVAVLDDKGDPIPDEGLSWIADGEHEALDVSPLCANCKAHVVCPMCVEMGVPATDRVAHALRAWFWGRDLSKLSPDLSSAWLDDLAKFLTSLTPPLPANPGDVDPHAGRRPPPPPPKTDPIA